MRICVYCASSELIDERYKLFAREVGMELAARGHSLVSGGGSVSSMGELARGARGGGAHTTGVIPQGLMRSELADISADELIVTASMRERKAEMDQRSDAFLVLAGGLGTLEELLEIWTSKFLGMHDKPLVMLDPFDSWASFRALIDDLIDRGFSPAYVRDHLQWAKTPAEAFDLIEVATG